MYLQALHATCAHVLYMKLAMHASLQQKNLQGYDHSCPLRLCLLSMVCPDMTGIALPLPTALSARAPFIDVAESRDVR